MRSGNTNGESNPHSAPILLNLTGQQIIKFSLPAPMIVDAGIKCDSEGNVFLAYSDSPQAVAVLASGPVPDWKFTDLEPVRKLVLDSRQAVQYVLRPIPGFRLYRKSFAVDADGALYMLLEATPRKTSKIPSNKEEYFIESFNKNGRFESKLRLVGPTEGHLILDEIGTFADGRYLAMGTRSLTSDMGRMQPFAGVFDSAGRFVQEVDFSRASKAKYAGPVAPGAMGETNAGLVLSIAAGSITSAPDGSIYLMEASNPLQIYDISPAGTVDRRAQVNIPVSGLSPLEAGIAGPGMLYVRFDHIGPLPPGVKPPKGIIAIINVEGGRLDRLYRLPPDASHGVMMGVCGDPQGNFLFLEASRDDKLEVAKYSSN